MLDVRVVTLPSLLTAGDVNGRTIVVFDVLRATTTMIAALAAGVTEIHLYPTLADCRAGRDADPHDAVLVGEAHCVRAEGFDLGNSPGQFGVEHRGRSMHMATTNGTRALLAPSELGAPHAVLAGALTNRLAVAKRLVALGADVTLLCAGTDGAFSYEDFLGCGAVLESLVNLKVLGTANDAALAAMGTWTWAVAAIVRAKPDAPAYPAGFRLALGAKNILEAGLPEDVIFAARPDVTDVVGTLVGRRIIKLNR